MIIYGSEFNNGALVLVLIMISSVPMQLATVAGMVNKCVGNIWWGVMLNSLWAAVYIVSTASLVEFGAIGLAWSTLIAYFCHLLFTTIYVYWVFRTSPKLNENLTE
jgi:O-antigen/teichoic acid export membrane protein